MSQLQGNQAENSFDGRIQLNGDAAPDLEVILELTDQDVVLLHSSGELGRWERAGVRVTPMGRGWFSLDVADEQVTFLPRRPGFFASSTLDLVPVEETKKGRRRREREERKAEAAKAKAAKTSRKERKRLQREEAAAATAWPATDPESAVLRDGLVSPPAEPSEDQPGLAELPAVELPAVAEPPPVEPEPVESPPEPVQSATTWLDPSEAPVPDLFKHRPAPVEPEPEMPASPWDDVPLPEVPEKGRRKGKRSGDDASKPDKKARPARKATEGAQEKPSKPRRGKDAKSLPTEAPKTRREKKPAAVAPSVTEPVGPPKKSATSRAFTAFKYGARGALYRISDELRQSGIVPFDRLPAAPARSRPDEDHVHDFQEHRLPGGLTRNVCHGCGLVSIGEVDGLGE